MALHIFSEPVDLRIVASRTGCSGLAGLARLHRFADAVYRSLQMEPDEVAGAEGFSAKNGLGKRIVLTLDARK